jgi:hypothetical protein
MSQFIRRTIPTVMMLVLGILMFIEFFFNVPSSYIEIMKDLRNFAVIIAAFAMGLGAINLLLIHGTYIRKRTPEQWLYSLWLLIVMAIFTIIGVTLGTASSQYQFFFQNFFMPNDMTLYSLIGWMVVYAIYLTFRARTYETLFLLIVAFFALIGNSPIGGAIWYPFVDIYNWLTAVPNTASVRGFDIAMALGAIIVGFRVLLGRERAAVGE